MFDGFEQQKPLSVSHLESVWTKTAEWASDEAAYYQNYVAQYPRLEGECSIDIAIIGGGITGLTAALLLQQAGRQVAVVEAHSVGYGVSGFNSGHLSSMLLDMRYSAILHHFGEEVTRTVALALHQSIDQIERNVIDYRIECDFKRLQGYWYAEQDNQLEGLQAEFEAAAQAGLVVHWCHHVPLPFPLRQGMAVDNQARFHPLKYVQGLAKRFVENGGQIFEQSPVTRLQREQEECHLIETQNGWLSANEVVLSTHTPIGFHPALQTRLEPAQSYIIGIRTRDMPEDALYWDMDEPYHYIRWVEDEQGTLLIIGGEDHKAGTETQTEVHFKALENYVRQRFDVQSVDYRWSAPLYNPVDGLPYIGKIGDVYVGTGYSGEGLTFGTLAGQILSEQIQGRYHPCAEILTPTRVKPIASAGGFISENVAVAKHWVQDRLMHQSEQEIPLEQIPVGEGRLIDLNGQQTAAYRDDSGKLHFMSPKCTHMGCIVKWNSAEKSWDCPCHGGRYSALGDVLNGPPTERLSPIEDYPS